MEELPQSEAPAQTPQPQETPKRIVEIRTLQVPAEGTERIDSWLAQTCEGFSRNRIQGLIDSGRVTLDGEPVPKPNFTPHPGGIVQIFIPPPVPPIPEPEDIPLSVVYEDDDILVIDKPPGMVAHPAPGHDDGTLVNALLHHCPFLSGIGGVARPGLVHRLDKDTSGVMVVAKTQLAMQALGSAFASHRQVGKTYLAIVHGTPTPAEGRIENLIARKPTQRKKMAVVEGNGKVAITNYRVVTGAIRDEFAHLLACVECRIETGRTHQIRVHMASLGHPIAGDMSYGRPSLDRLLPNPPARQMLHAWRLDLVHPATHEQLHFEVPPPADFMAFMKQPDLREA